MNIQEKSAGAYKYLSVFYETEKHFFLFEGVFVSLGSKEYFKKISHRETPNRRKHKKPSKPVRTENQRRTKNKHSR